MVNGMGGGEPRHHQLVFLALEDITGVGDGLDVHSGDVVLVVSPR